MKKNIMILVAAVFCFPAVLTAQQKIDELKQEKKQLKKELKVVKKEERGLRKQQKNSEVGDEVKQNFKLDFPCATDVSYAVSKWFDEVNFKKEGNAMTAYYDWKSKLVGSSQFKSFTDLPERAQAAIKKKYSSYQPGSVIFYDDNESNDTNMVLYGNEFEDADNFFVELKNNSRRIIVQVTMDGAVSFFSEVK